MYFRRLLTSLTLSAWLAMGCAGNLSHKETTPTRVLYSTPKNDSIHNLPKKEKPRTKDKEIDYLVNGWGDVNVRYRNNQATGPIYFLKTNCIHDTDERSFSFTGFLKSSKGTLHLVYGENFRDRTKKHSFLKLTNRENKEVLSVTDNGHDGDVDSVKSIIKTTEQAKRMFSDVQKVAKYRCFEINF